MKLKQNTATSKENILNSAIKTTICNLRKPMKRNALLLLLCSCCMSSVKAQLISKEDTSGANRNVLTQNEVVISGSRNAIRHERLKTVLKVSGNPRFSSLTNMADALNKVPGLKINTEGMLLSSSGNIVSVFINGSPLKLSAKERMAYLKRIKPDSVNCIEVLNKLVSPYPRPYETCVDLKLKR